MSPTERALADLKRKGYKVARVEHWNHWARIRQDLFGFIDLLAIAPGIILGVQVTSGTNHAARRSKALSLPILRDWLEAGGRFDIWSYSLRKIEGRKKWTLRAEPITLETLCQDSASACDSTEPMPD